MRFLLALTLTLLLTGCPSGKPPSVGKSSQAPAPPSPAQMPQSGESNPVEFAGTWTTTDEQGQVFDLVLFPNGQTVTNWTKGTAGARGQRGLWRQENGKLIAQFDDGWTDVIQSVDGAFVHRGFSPGVPLDGTPTNQAPARRLEGPEAVFVGVWRMNKEPDGSYLYLALQSNGRALSTINGGTEGKWEKTEKGALCTWPDGWADLIERSSEGWQKRSWVGTETSTTADLSIATRVGEKRYEITP
ncbi:MAG: hypothetical protein ACOYMS_03690 [Terrimicrobiaceae bacterium]